MQELKEWSLTSRSFSASPPQVNVNTWIISIKGKINRNKEWGTVIDAKPMLEVCPL